MPGIRFGARRGVLLKGAGVAAGPAGVPVLFSWGLNNGGQLGLGNLTAYSSPVQVGALSNWATLSASYWLSLAIKTDGTLWSWGQGTSGRLGLGNTTAYSSPKQVGALTTWAKISAARSGFSLAIKTDGTLWSWGNNANGQLGLGDTTARSSPVQVGALTAWAMVSGGAYNSFAIKTDGTLWSWGANGNSELGLGNLTQYSSPKQVGALTNWATVAGSRANALAVKTDGTLWSWGFNGLGQGGLGNLTQYSSPKQVGALTTWSKISAARYFSAAIKTDGTFWAWGQNTLGQLGLGNATDYSSPKQVGALTTWSKLSVNGQGTACFSVAIKTDGTLWSWGDNNNGQLGLGNITGYSSPKQVGALTTWSTIETGGSRHSLAIKT